MDCDGGASWNASLPGFSPLLFGIVAAICILDLRVLLWGIIGELFNPVAGHFFGFVESFKSCIGKTVSYWIWTFTDSLMIASANAVAGAVFAISEVAIDELFEIDHPTDRNDIMIKVYTVDKP
jgi:hypothetical protein